MQALGREMASWFGSLEWCNPVVTFTPMITEAFNTLSNIPGIILALIGFINTVHMRFEHRFKILHIVSVVVGLASMLLHCSLKARQQHTDEIPMVWIMLVYIDTLYSPGIHYAHFKPALHVLLVVYAGAFAVLHSTYHSLVGFELHYLFLILVCAPGMVKHYVNTTDALALRLAHQYLLLQYSRARQLDLDPRLRYIGGVLPYVKVLAKNRRTMAVTHEDEILNKQE